MPQRFLKPGLRTSDAWNRTSFEAQSLYIGILTLVDDFGRYDGRAALLHGECFPLRNAADGCTPQRTAALLQQLAAEKLIQLYTHEGKEYLQVLRWTERTRAVKSKYPKPPDNPQDSAAGGSGTRPPSSPSPSPSPHIVPVPAGVCAPALAREGEPAAEPVQHAEAESVLRTIAAKVFGETITTWGEKPIYDHWLDEALPIPRKQFEACQWLYGLPKDHEVFTDQRNLAFTRRRQSFNGFMAGLKAECQKAEVVREKWGGNGADDYRAPPWPPGMLETFRAVWPDREAPEGFMELCQTDREELMRKRKKKAVAA